MLERKSPTFALSTQFITRLSLYALLIEELKALDEVAYIRFASVYRQFQDVEAFKKEIEKLMSK